MRAKSLASMLVTAGLVLAIAPGNLLVAGQAPATIKPAWQASSSAMDSGKKADIERLMRITGARNIGGEFAKQMVAQMKPLLAATLPPGERSQQVVDRFLQKLLARVDSGDLFDRQIPLYDTYFTHVEIKGLVEFYESPVGRKSIAVLPKLMQDSMEVSQKWAQEVIPQILQEMEQEFPELKQRK